ncbi:MAG: hypothetical protein ACREOK_09775 [Gemmatimonadaceae bacterium]
MMRRFAIALAIAIASNLQAQGTLVVSQNKCANDKMQQIQQTNDSLFMPIVQELVNEGKLLGAGTAYHAWGDEWNVVVWYTATNAQAFFDAFNELFRRMQQRHPTVITQQMAWCTDHKDNIYRMGRATVAAAPPANRQP